MRLEKTVLFFVLFPRMALHWQASVSFASGIAPGENAAHSPRAFPLGDEPPMGAPHVKSGPRRSARARRPRPRICLRKGCGRKYQPRSWNQRYCQDPECRRQVHRWQAARRQAKRRQNADVKARHAQSERAPSADPVPISAGSRT